MPLTPSHAAAAWPLSRLVPQLPLAALVIGCLAPDFEYLLLLAPRGRTWHTPLGLMALAIPAGILVWIAWVELIRPAVRELFPPRLQSALEPQRWSVPLVLTGALAVALGALSHVAWDGLTHAGGWGVTRWSVLETPVGIGLATAPLYKLLQHGSTLLGAFVMALWTLAWWRRQPVKDRVFAPGQLDTLIAVLGGLAAAGVLGGVLNALRSPSGLAFRLGYAAVGVMLAVGLALLAWGCSRWRSVRRPPQLRDR